MFIRRLLLDHFRNYQSAMIDAAPGLIVLAGENGAGKTNILEAISLLAPGRGLRGSALPEMLRDGDGAAHGFAIAADIAPDADAPAVTLGTGVEPGRLTRRVVRVNGATQSANSLGEWLSILWLTPAMDRIFLDSAGGRRRFLDRMVLALAPGHASHAARYEAAMRARTKLLSEAAAPGGLPADPHWLDALEAQMAEHGAAMDGARRGLVTALGQSLAILPDQPFARPLVHLEGDAWSADKLADALKRNRGQDGRAGRALAGPHRADLAVTHAAKRQPAARCSTGEQKALLLSIILAHGDLVAEQRGARPILLLDELAAHLDPLRRAALYQRLADGGGQVWMTGTEMTLFDDAPQPVIRFAVSDGVVERAG